MKCFINIKNGNVEIPHNRDVIEQYQKSRIYCEYDPALSSYKELTYNQLKKKAKEMGIKYENTITKAKLLELISNY